jgi:hypothetical protein
VSAKPFQDPVRFWDKIIDMLFFHSESSHYYEPPNELTLSETLLLVFHVGIDETIAAVVIMIVANQTQLRSY